MSKKSNVSLFDDETKIQQCIKYLNDCGYGVFKADSVDSVAEEEAVRKLKLIGYKVESPQNALIKVDVEKVTTVDDIAIYFHHMMKRRNPKRHIAQKLKNKKHRLIDHSVINSLLSWKLDEGASLSEALQDLFILIDVLFDEAQKRRIDIKGIGILSINSNKAFVLALMHEVNNRKDAKLSFEVEQLIKKQDQDSYYNILAAASEQLNGSGDKPIVTRRIIQEGLRGKKETKHK